MSQKNNSNAKIFSSCEPVYSSNNKNEICLKPILHNSSTNKATQGKLISNDESSQRLSVESNNDGAFTKFLPSKRKQNVKKKTLVLDLDETLIHSGTFPINTYIDISFNIQLEDELKEIFTLIRPGAREFLSKMVEIYEIVIFTASLSKYAKPIIDQLDVDNTCSHRLYREHCTIKNNSYIKELNKLGRDLKDVILLDNSPISYLLNTENGLPIKSWTHDVFDRELFLIIPLLEFLSEVSDVRDYIKKMYEKNDYSYDNAMTIKFMNNMEKIESQNDPKPELKTINNNIITKVSVSRDSINCKEPSEVSKKIVNQANMNANDNKNGNNNNNTKNKNSKNNNTSNNSNNFNNNVNSNGNINSDNSKSNNKSNSNTNNGNSNNNMINNDNNSNINSNNTKSNIKRNSNTNNGNSKNNIINNYNNNYCDIKSSIKSNSNNNSNKNNSITNNNSNNNNIDNKSNIKSNNKCNSNNSITNNDNNSNNNINSENNNDNNNSKSNIKTYRSNNNSNLINNDSNNHLSALRSKTPKSFIFNKTGLPSITNESEKIKVYDSAHLPFNLREVNHIQNQKTSVDKSLIKNNFLRSSVKTVITPRKMVNDQKNLLNVTPKKIICGFHRNVEDLSKMYSKNLNNSSKSKLIFKGYLNNSQTITKNPIIESYILKKGLASKNTNLISTSINNMNNCNLIKKNSIFVNNSYRIAE